MTLMAWWHMTALFVALREDSKAKYLNRSYLPIRFRREESGAPLSRTNVDVWGAIYLKTCLKTDGQRLITAFKIEAGSPTKKWFYFEYERDVTGQLTLVRRV